MSKAIQEWRSFGQKAVEFLRSPKSNPLSLVTYLVLSYKTDDIAICTNRPCPESLKFAKFYYREIIYVLAHLTLEHT